MINTFKGYAVFHWKLMASQCKSRSNTQHTDLSKNREFHQDHNKDALHSTLGGKTQRKQKRRSTKGELKIIHQQLSETLHLYSFTQKNHSDFLKAFKFFFLFVIYLIRPS